MIHYHGTPVTPQTAAAEILTGRHALVSFAHPGDIDLVAQVCQSFILDNGAFTFWKRGDGSRRGLSDWNDYVEFLETWAFHPGCDFFFIPDIIDGTEDENYQLIDEFCNAHNYLIGQAVPVYHLHESLEHFERLCRSFSRIALGSSGQYAQIATPEWWARMDELMQLSACDSRIPGRPRVKLHGLRMLDPRIFGRLPLSSADSTNVARNIGLDTAWRGSYQPPSKAWRGNVLAARIEANQSADCYIPQTEPTQQDSLF